jgi:thioredoxin-like negative regulator of GroEL
MRKVIGLFLALVCLVAIIGAYFYWPSIKFHYNKLMVDKEQEAKDIKEANDLLSQNKPEAALEIIQKYADTIDNRTESGKEWVDLLIRASEATNNVPQLMTLYEYYPKSLNSHEKAALIVASAYIVSGRARDYQTLRDGWKGRETKPETWFVLDADKLILEGKRKEAIDFLHSKTFPGKTDTARLIRLALLVVLENPKEAWDYLSEAYNKDPTNPDILSYRAKLLETVGKNSLALAEYIAAIQTDPKNIYLKDQLAEFYMRQKQYPLALGVWTENLKEPSLDFIWLKSIFWSKVVIPVKVDWKSLKPPKGKLEPFIAYLLSLKPGQFWDTDAFEKIPDYQQYLKTQQATFWLRLLQLLKEGKDKEAADQLQFNPFSSVSWNPDLEKALKQILLYRKTGKLSDEVATNPNEKDKKDVIHSVTFSQNEPFFFEQLDFFTKNPPSEKNKFPPELHELLKGPEAFAAALLSAGWDEAGLDLNKLEAIPANYPQWVPFLITQALRRNKGNQEALAFAKKQKAFPALSMLIGEIEIANHQEDAAIEELKKLAKDPTDVGQRAAWLISLVYIEHGQYKEAKDVILAQPLLVKDVAGQESLARIALLEGNTDTADRIYSSLEKISPEAKSYLAKKAFAEKDWSKAKELTEELLRDYPTNTVLQQNYKKIIEEQNKLNKQKMNK